MTIILFLFLLLLSLSNNFPLLLHFRLIDILVIVAFSIQVKFYNLSYRTVILVLLFFSLAIFSSIVNESVNGKLVELVFYYKYFFFLAAIILARSFITLFDEQKLQRHYKLFSRAFLFLAVFLILYVFFFVADNMTMAVGGMTRVSIPFSSFEEGASNSPSFSLVFALIFIYMDKAKKSYSLIIMVCASLALLLCGSRTGVFAVVLYYALFRKWNLRFLLWGAVLFALATPILIHYMSGDNLVSGLLERAINFELSSDESANGRVFKQLEAFRSTEDFYYLLGIGHENTAILWYDGLVGNLQVFVGLIGVIIFYVLYFDIRLKDGSFIFFDIILLTSFISEFVLISYVVGFALMLTFLLKFDSASGCLRNKGDVL